MKLSKLDVSDLLTSGPPSDVGRCRGCKVKVGYFQVSVSGQKCPNCKRGEEQIDWYDSHKVPAGYLVVEPEEDKDWVSWRYDFSKLRSGKIFSRSRQ